MASKSGQRKAPIPAALAAAVGVVALALAAAVGSASVPARLFALLYILASTLLWVVLIFMLWGEGREGAAYAVLALAVLFPVPVLVGIALS